MALIKQPVAVNFSQGLDLKTDPNQVQIGKFLSLENSIFDVGGRLTKRNGYGFLTDSVLGVGSSPATTLSASYLTTFNSDLTALGSSLYAYSIPNKGWVNKGPIQPISLATMPLIRSNTNQSQLDTAVAPNGLVCTVYTDNLPSGIAYKYAIADSATGQNIVAPTLIPAQSGGTVTGSPRVFVLGSYFLICYTNVITATSHLQYVAISTTNPTGATILGELASAYVAKTTLSWDGVVYSNSFYFAYNNTTGGQNIKINTLSSNLVIGATKTFAGEICTMMSITVDSSNPSVPIIWAAYYDAAGSTGKAFAVTNTLATVLAPTTIIATGTYLNITCTAQNSVLTFFAEHSFNYVYDPAIPSHFINSGTLTQAGTLTGPTTLVRSVGLASKAFIYNEVSYFLGIYSSNFQPSYFLINDSGNVISRIAYSNGGTYDTTGLPSVTLTGAVAQMGYMIKDLIAATNKGTSLSALTPVNPVYSQLGLNLVSFNLTPNNLDTSEIGTNLNLTGGYIGSYDGYTITEQNFFLWPDNVEASQSTTGGTMSAQEYFYQVTYEWADNAGNVFRSAPSIPASVTTTGSTSSTNINVPMLRLTYKTANPVKIVVYRWSQAQQVYYAIASPSQTPIFNDPTQQSVTIIDTLPDASILGNPILYTTGGVLEDIGPPSSSIMTLFNNRLWLVDAEDTNLLWYSKQVIESTPVEMSDLLTMFIAPTTGSQGSTGPITALAPMDDKLIIFKENALGYINGSGPDNTGANSTYSDLILINSVVGCTNQKSIVLTPQGLMFQSNKGIWLLGRDLSTTYIGAPVESDTTGATVDSAENIPKTNQVRFTLDTGITLMFDYYYNQWGTFTNVPAVSSTIFQDLHTYIDSYSRIFQETPGKYLDNTNPVLMSFTTGWANVAALQGYQRFYFMFLLGTYESPFKLNATIAYNYNDSDVQNITVTPNAPTPAWGGDPLWGSSTPWGGPGKVFQARIFPKVQKCESFQLSVSEMYDPSFGIQAGAGLTLSGMNVIIGVKKPYRTATAARSFG